MDDHDKIVTVNIHSNLALPNILQCAAMSRIENFEEVYDCLMVAAFNKIMLPEDRLDGVDDDDARFAKAMLKITAFSILELLDDFDAEAVIKELEDDEKH